MDKPKSATTAKQKQELQNLFVELIQKKDFKAIEDAFGEQGLATAKRVLEKITDQTHENKERLSAGDSILYVDGFMPIAKNPVEEKIMSISRNKLGEVVLTLANGMILTERRKIKRKYDQKNNKGLSLEDSPWKEVNKFNCKIGNNGMSIQNKMKKKLAAKLQLAEGKLLTSLLNPKVKDLMESSKLKGCHDTTPSTPDNALQFQLSSSETSDDEIETILSGKKKNENMRESANNHTTGKASKETKSQENNAIAKISRSKKVATKAKRPVTARKTKKLRDLRNSPVPAFKRCESSLEESDQNENNLRVNPKVLIRPTRLQWEKSFDTPLADVSNKVPGTNVRKRKHNQVEFQRKPAKTSDNAYMSFENGKHKEKGSTMCRKGYSDINPSRILGTMSLSQTKQKEALVQIVPKNNDSLDNFEIGKQNYSMDRNSLHEGKAQEESVFDQPDSTPQPIISKSIKMTSSISSHSCSSMQPAMNLINENMSPKPHNVETVCLKQDHSCKAVGEMQKDPSLLEVSSHQKQDKHQNKNMLKANSSKGDHETGLSSNLGKLHEEAFTRLPRLLLTHNSVVFPELILEGLLKLGIPNVESLFISGKPVCSEKPGDCSVDK